VSTRQLREQVLEANLAIVSSGLAKLTWGNTSGLDRDRGLVAIKPSGVPYTELDADAIVIVDLDGELVEGDLRPSTDTATHLELYRAFPSVGGITHTHSSYATAFAQARREIPFLGTTHADHFRGPVPVTRPMTPEETASNYELNTGRVIVERFAELDPATARSTPCTPRSCSRRSPNSRCTRSRSHRRRGLRQTTSSSATTAGSTDPARTTATVARRTVT
jgi:L-ribulose-5-phosphate 4-epimerase